jgi:glutathione synthase/RimK-type ligase-like ATP-grasp enzyme
MLKNRIAIYYEHRNWSQPLFAELDRRNLPYDRLQVEEHTFDPSVREIPYGLVVNRVSAYPSGGSRPEIVWYAQQYLAYLQRIQANVINGYDAFLVGASKAIQLAIFEQLKLPYPRARVIHAQAQALQAATGLTFPIVIKPNVGGSGVGIRQFDSLEELEQAANTEFIDLGLDHTALIQEFLPAEGGYIVRVEIMNNAFLYAIRLPITENSFNYCPADGCNIDNPALKIESYHPPKSVIEAAKQIVAASQADLGGVEYLVNARDGQIYYYDINPLSNFVADAPRVVGFDPTAKFVDFLADRLRDSQAGSAYIAV